MEEKKKASPEQVDDFMRLVSQLSPKKQALVLEFMQAFKEADE